jgi:hypothetical protein
MIGIHVFQSIWDKAFTDLPILSQRVRWLYLLRTRVVPD